MWILFTTARTARLWDLNLIISWLFVQHSAWWGSGKGNINPYFSLALSPVLSAVALSTSITLIFAITLPHIEKNPIVHPKIQILSSFTPPQVVLKLMVAIDFHCMEKKYYGIQWGPRTVWLHTFFTICFFVFSRRKKFIQVWNSLTVSKLWWNFHFWVNYSFKH